VLPRGRVGETGGERIIRERAIERMFERGIKMGGGGDTDFLFVVLWGRASRKTCYYNSFRKKVGEGHSSGKSKRRKKKYGGEDRKGLGLETGAQREKGNEAKRKKIGGGEKKGEKRN